MRLVLGGCVRTVFLITTLDPRPALQSKFPLGTFRNPAPPMPYSETPGLVSDASRPLVLFGYTKPVAVFLVKDPVTDSVVVSR